jgi:hypothetical protein
MREQIANHNPPRRASATAEELAARRTGNYPPANPHRAGHYSGLHPEDQPYTSTQIDDDDRIYNTRLPSSARRYQTDVDGRVIQQGNRRIVIHNAPPPRRGQEPEYETEPARPRRRVHWLVYIGLAMFIMILGWITFNALSNWWQTTQDDWHYGRPRTFQIDAVVGHHDSASNPSHFIATNLNGKITIIEIPGGDASHSVIYIGPALLGQGQDLTPVTISFNDVNGDGKPDMILHVLNQNIIFLNNGSKFDVQKTQ